MKMILAAIAASVSTLAGAVTVTTDFSDMWWIPSESGWGANMIQQGDTIFVTLFVYDSSNKAVWYVGPATTYGGTINGAQHFTGPLYSVTGPYFGASTFDPGSVGVTQVGNVSFDAPASATGTLAYSVNGVNVTKNVQRQTWRNDTLAGTYRGASIGTYTRCPGTTTIDFPNTLTITQVASSVIINEFGTGFGGTAYSCRYTGTYTQSGKLGTITGTETCSDGSLQSFTASNIQVSADSVSMAIVSDVSVCHFSGRIGGMREPQ